MVEQPKNIHGVTRTSARRWRLVAALMGLLLAASADSSWAKLGGDLASVQSDQQAWGATATPTALSGATLITQNLPNGLTVRQYVDPAGSVFAVAWEGPVLPDFAQLLGEHYPAYDHAVRTQRRGVSVQNANLILQSGGMMRAFSGHAYLPAKLPASLTAQDIH
jgi:hypothetical protein